LVSLLTSHSLTLLPFYSLPRITPYSPTNSSNTENKNDCNTIEKEMLPHKLKPQQGVQIQTDPNKNRKPVKKK